MKADVQVNLGLAGYFRFVRRGPTGEVRQDTGLIKNIITDAGLNMRGGNAWQYCSVGTGSATPAASDTSLSAFLASTLTRSVSQASTYVANSGAPYVKSTVTFRFSTGVATGNISEVGIGTQPNGTSLWSRALITDPGTGSPTTITVLSDETLDVTYECHLYIPTGDVTGTTVVDGTTYTLTMRAARAPAWQHNDGFSTPGDIAPASFVNSWARGDLYTGAPLAYDVNDYPGTQFARSDSGTTSVSAWSGGSSTFTVGFPLSGAGTAQSFQFTDSFGANYQIGISPGISKTTSQTMTVSYTLTRSRHAA